MEQLLAFLGRIMHRLNLEDAFVISLEILSILLIAKIVLVVSERFVNHLFHIKRLATRLDDRRTKTLIVLLQSFIRYLVYFVVLVTILQLFNVPVSSVLTTAGIAGLALAFGAQNLIKDVITGFFIVFEDQFGIGDQVTLAGVSGIVEEMGLRTTRVRDFGGQLHIIPNGKIEMVTNFMGPAMLAVVDIPVGYQQSLEQVISLLKVSLTTYGKEHPELVEKPQIMGVQSFTEHSVVLRIIARTKPKEQFKVEREIRQMIVGEFLNLGIEHVLYEGMSSKK